MKYARLSLLGIFWMTTLQASQPSPQELQSQILEVYKMMQAIKESQSQQAFEWEKQMYKLRESQHSQMLEMGKRIHDILQNQNESMVQTLRQPGMTNQPSRSSIEVAVSPNIIVRSSNDAEAKTAQVTQNTQTFSDSMARMYEEMMKKLKIINEEKYKYTWHAIAVCLASAYVFVYYHVYNLNKLLECKTSWCRWKEVIPLHQLCMGGCDDVIGQLMFDIHKKYYQKESVAAALVDDQLFIKDVLAERSILQWYLSMQTWTNRLYVARFFPLRYTKEMIQEYIARLEVITDLFLQKCCQQELGYTINPNGDKVQD